MSEKKFSVFTLDVVRGVPLGHPDCGTGEIFKDKFVHADALDAANKRIEELETDNELIVRANALLADESNDLRGDNQVCFLKINELQKRIAELEAEAKKYVDAIFAWEKTSGELGEALKAEKSRVAELEAKLAHRHIIGKSYEINKENFVKVIGELDECRSRIAELEKQLEYCRNQNIKHRAERAQTSSELGARVAELEEIVVLNQKISIQHQKMTIEYKQALDSEKAKTQKAIEILSEWLGWEAEQIRKEGPYVGKRINELIEKGNKILAELAQKESK